MKKYIFTGETMEFEGHVLKRIQYVKEISFVEKGQLGGWLESESNLSHDGECSVMNEAKVFGYGKVMGNAIVVDKVIVKDNAQIMGDSYISDCAIVGADTIVGGNSSIMDESKVFFYKTATSSNEANIQKVVLVEGKTLIEATGFIDSGIFKNRYVSGTINGK